MWIKFTYDVEYVAANGTANGAATTKVTKPRFFEDYGIWKQAPILTGSTKFEPLPDVKNIMITGGAGFM